MPICNIQHKFKWADKHLNKRVRQKTSAMQIKVANKIAVESYRCNLRGRGEKRSLNEASSFHGINQELAISGLDWKRQFLTVFNSMGVR